MLFNIKIFVETVVLNRINKTKIQFTEKGKIAMSNITLIEFNEFSRV